MTLNNLNLFGDTRPSQVFFGRALLFLGWFFFVLSLVFHNLVHSGIPQQGALASAKKSERCSCMAAASPSPTPCHSHAIGGIEPHCLNFIEGSNYSAAWHILAYGGTYYTKAYANARKLATISKHDIIISVGGTQSIRYEEMLKQFKAEFPEGPQLYFVMLSEEQFSAKPGQKISTGLAPVAYKKMNRWRIKTQFELVLPHNYTYIIQLDSNLLITLMPCDPVEVMVRSRSLFGWYNAGIEQR